MLPYLVRILSGPLWLFIDRLDKVVDALNPSAQAVSASFGTTPVAAMMRSAAASLRGPTGPFRSCSVFCVSMRLSASLEDPPDTAPAAGVCSMGPAGGDRREEEGWLSYLAGN